MTDRKKLLGEVERELKRVRDGYVDFDKILHRLKKGNNLSTNQVSKLETDLKKEIKKLQRKRDKMKSWLSNNNIRDKTSIIEARKKIEDYMEKFKKYENSRSNNKDFETNQAEMVNQEQIEWLEEHTELLSDMIEEAEADIEELETKETSDDVEADAILIAELAEKVDHHTLHFKCLRKLLHMMNNGKIQADDVEYLQDPIKQYLEKSNNGGNLENFAGIYDQMELNFDETSSEEEFEVAAEPDECIIKTTELVDEPESDLYKEVPTGDFSQLDLLTRSMNLLPERYDNERPKDYKPKNPFPVPDCYPTEAPTIFEDEEMFKKFETDTLFFIFYYQQGTYQQYLAAKELKKHSWRYHKKYLTWFQRHEEPEEITPDYEQGTYVYFDYETGWCQRKKAKFTFEYRYLEDKDLM
eukprot:TRINITY_DN2173_c0_g1_i1.p1 TRINITY_DN2173_c0_g1~~TRINITY_DN2173_c0_g1_i1.p1  ORF type:complete len:412 (-),score=123.48 TRINITY_DN2173_c0_g1_i1:37-1272(-)